MPSGDLGETCGNQHGTDPGYGEDNISGSAEQIKRRAPHREAAVHFLVGGTQTNVTVISAALRHYQGVITAVTGHINVHETGALESCGHKCLTIETADGKLTAEQIATYTDAHYADASFRTHGSAEDGLYFQSDGDWHDL